MKFRWRGASAMKEKAMKIPTSPTIPAEAVESTSPLEFTRENFDLLLAANGEHRQRITDLADRIEALKAAVQAAQLRDGDRQQENDHLKAKLGDANADREYFSGALEAEKLRLQRTLGYLDRVLDEEARPLRGDSETITVPKPAPSQGPDLNSIHVPVRRRAPDTAMDMMAGSLRMHDDQEPRRRY